jgi:hypothetical protein
VEADAVLVTGPEFGQLQRLEAARLGMERVATIRSGSTP